MGLNGCKILIAELMDEEAIAVLKESCQVDVKYKLPRAELLEIIPEYHAIVIRSETIIDEEFLDTAVNMKIVGRGGSGLDNVNIDYATKKGVIIANTPESNIVSAAEHTMALMLSSARNVVWADRFIKSGSWDRKRFSGSELLDKVIGIIGLGRIGGLVAERLAGFDPKKIIAYDPYISDSRFEKYGAEKMTSLEALCKEADIITIHTPRTKETIDIVADREIAMMKDGVRLVNVARGGLFNEQSLVKGLESGKLASVALDVWDNEPQDANDIYKFDTMVGTPHLGASTHEAALRVGMEVGSEVLAGLKGEMVKNAVNIPSVSDSVFKKLRSFIELSGKIGKLYSQISKTSLKKIEISFSGNEIEDKEDVRILSLMAIKGMLERSVPETVNFVNATLIAEQKGIEIVESLKMSHKNFSNLITLNAHEEDGNILSISGTVFDGKYPRIVKIDEYRFDLDPKGRLLYAPHKNVPGVIGKVGTKMAEYNVNISKMIVSDGADDSLMFLSVDNNVPEELVAKIKEFDEIKDAFLIEM
ncbi:MAG: phosphoglycerate dehydrogenase [Desulfobacter sp.]|nr:MAG: phosphoglycerate dehydrogenase [Desulfobacter sp.]